MLDIGWSEYLFIAVLALVLLGPKELPIVLRTIGRFVAKAKEMTSSLQEQFYNLEQEQSLKENPFNQEFQKTSDSAYPFPQQFLSLHAPVKAPKAYPLPWV
jgi:sec-independent protein translocase protein TatB